MEYLAGAYIVLRIALGCTVAGLFVTFFNDKDIRILIEKRKMKMKIVKKFNIENEHCTVIGLTQHGKTYGTIKTLERMNEKIFFFNTQHTQVGSGWVEATGANSIEQIIFGLEKGYKINFLPADESLEKMSVQLGAIIENIYVLGKMDCRIVIDEVHLFKMAKDKRGHNALIRLATTGLGRGFKCVFLSQRGAMVDNTIYSQSTKHIIFALGKPDYQYMKNLGFPVDEIIAMTKNEKYVFCEFDQKDVKGAFKIG